MAMYLQGTLPRVHTTENCAAAASTLYSPDELPLLADTPSPCIQLKARDHHVASSASTSPCSSSPWSAIFVSNMRCTVSTHSWTALVKSKRKAITPAFGILCL